MVYKPEEKKKMENLLEVFAQYTAQHQDFDIAYSDKTGYVRLIIAESADTIFFKIKDFNDLMDMFCMEIVADEVDKQLNEKPHLNNWDIDYDSIRRNLQKYIDQLDEANREQAATVANRYIYSRAISIYLP